METLTTLLMIIGFIGFIVAVIAIIKPIPRIYLPTRKRASLTLAASFFVFALGAALIPSREQVEQVRQEAAQQEAEHQKEKEHLEQALAGKEAELKKQEAQLNQQEELRKKTERLEQELAQKEAELKKQGTDRSQQEGLREKIEQLEQALAQKDKQLREQAELRQKEQERLRKELTRKETELKKQEAETTQAQADLEKEKRTAQAAKKEKERLEKEVAQAKKERQEELAKQAAQKEKARLERKAVQKAAAEAKKLKEAMAQQEKAKQERIQQAASEKKTPKVAPSTMGKWSNSRTPAAGVVKILHRNGKYFYEQTYSSGSVTKYELTEAGTETERRFNLNNAFKEYVIILKNGDLGYYDSDGLVMTYYKDEEKKSTGTATARTVTRKKTTSTDSCGSDKLCWYKKHIGDVEVYCSDYIERLAKYDFEWTDGFLGKKFTHTKWKNQSKRIMSFIGDQVKFQNGYGAWITHDLPV